MRSITTLDLQHAHRFYGFKGETQYLHGHTGVLTLETEASSMTVLTWRFLAMNFRKRTGRR